MVVIAPQYTQKTYTWPNFKAIQALKGFAIQVDEDEEKFFIYGYDGPEVHLSLIYKSAVPFYVVLDQALNDAWKADFIANVQPKANKAIEISRNNPFAEPTHRTKFNATETITEILPGESKTVDFRITQELYVMGGNLLSQGQEFGDYVSAEVIDKDGIIPEAYRPALCEAWPTVSKYIEKMWMNPSGVSEINTYPLNAKIAAGLYLRLTYNAISTGNQRKVCANYYLSKRL